MEAEEPKTLAHKLSHLERSEILAALQATGGNKTEAARRLDIDRKTLHRKIGEYGITVARQVLDTDEQAGEGR